MNRTSLYIIIFPWIINVISVVSVVCGVDYNGVAGMFVYPEKNSMLFPCMLAAAIQTTV